MNFEFVGRLLCDGSQAISRREIKGFIVLHCTGLMGRIRPELTITCRSKGCYIVPEQETSMRSPDAVGRRLSGYIAQNDDRRPMVWRAPGGWASADRVKYRHPAFERAPVPLVPRTITVPDVWVRSAVQTTTAFSSPRVHYITNSTSRIRPRRPSISLIAAGLDAVDSNHFSSIHRLDKLLISSSQVCPTARRDNRRWGCYFIALGNRVALNKSRNPQLSDGNRNTTVQSEPQNCYTPCALRRPWSQNSNQYPDFNSSIRASQPTYFRRFSTAGLQA